MFQGNWTCSKCGGEIKELPFEPRSEQGLTCRDCYFKDKDNNSTPAPAEPEAGEMDDREAPPFDPEGATAGEPAPESPEMANAPVATGEKKMFEGDWPCSVCGGSITSLPFEPRGTAGLKCSDCFRKG